MLFYPCEVFHALHRFAGCNTGKGLPLMDKTLQVRLENAELAAKLKGSLLLFIQAFFPILTGREFIISKPIGRESHFITVCRALTKCTYLESLRLLINLPPGHAKSTLVSFWIAWCYAKWGDCNFLYISYSKTLATSHTENIKRLMSLSQYKTIFGVHLREDSQAKDAFTTEAGGTVASFGAAGAITGRNAGLPGLERFSGAVIIDDSHKPDEVHSDLIRESVITNYRETIQQRPRGINVPIVFIGQRLHEQDLPAYFIAGEDGYTWDKVILKSIDDAGNALYPEAFPLDMLLIRQQKDRYVFAAQHQQDPQPAGGGLYTPEDFPLLQEEPEYYITFITADTAETDDPRNDATVFSFWGMYNIETEGRKTGIMGLHWIACREIRVEPKDLEREFLDFWQDCARHPNPPLLAYIEKKSTGVTLISILKNMRGLKVREIERTRRSGSKAQRFIDIQPYIAAKQVSLPAYAPHTEMCVNHMKKITNNDSHAHDDIADTCADAVRIALIDKSLSVFTSKNINSRETTLAALNRYNNVIELKRRAYGRRD
jgi:predicted phage terminase large subunit-like protein